MRKDNKKTIANKNHRQRDKTQLESGGAMKKQSASKADTDRLLQELQVHQTELQMQNEELQKAQNEAQTALSKYTDLYDFAPVGYLTLAKDGIIKNVNFIGAKVLNNDRSGLIGRPFGIFVSEEARSTFNVFLKKAFLETSSATCEVSLSRDDGESQFIRITATISETGDECRMIIVDITKSKGEEVTLKGNRDQLENIVSQRTADLEETNLRLQQGIIERKDIEKALRKSEKRYRHLFDSITSYTYRVDIVDGVASYTEHDEGCQKVTGYMPEDYIENNSLWLEMIQEEDKKVVLEAISKILNLQEPITIEHRIIRKDGDLRWISNTLVPHHNSEGTLIFYDGIITDITERKHHEGEQKRMELELHLDQKLCALGELASGVAHEVRNPLNAIIITIGLLAERLKDKPECRVHIDRVIRQVNRLENLMKDLLELRRPEEGRNRQRKTIANLCRMAVDVWKQSHKKMRNKLAINFSEAAECTEVFVDPERIVQVVSNILDNATHHSAIGTEIRISLPEPSEGFVIILIQDKGEGLPSEQKSHSFDSFSTSHKGGTGLGLSIVKHIIDTYQGQIAIYNNNPPPGCTVEIRIPVAAEVSP